MDQQNAPASSTNETPAPLETHTSTVALQVLPHRTTIVSPKSPSPPGGQCLLRACARYSARSADLNEGNDLLCGGNAPIPELTSRLRAQRVLK
ncbi:hypothetical protein AAFF_G00094780 [Aldrovandia affinis]|uniref:Uncharacterized protein n=1 Tax=Aldrovandia affinis TaxID=143900 RepID=A0AAD7T473_9TELE|nr:hypothetical protein AAFF_G00094780 [Aldrovandia affinis]